MSLPLHILVCPYDEYLTRKNNTMKYDTDKKFRVGFFPLHTLVCPYVRRISSTTRNKQTTTLTTIHKTLLIVRRTNDHLPIKTKEVHQSTDFPTVGQPKETSTKASLVVDSTNFHFLYERTPTDNGKPSTNTETN